MHDKSISPQLVSIAHPRDDDGVSLCNGLEFKSQRSVIKSYSLPCANDDERLMIVKRWWQWLTFATSVRIQMTWSVVKSYNLWCADDKRLMVVVRWWQWGGSSCGSDDQPLQQMLEFKWQKVSNKIIPSSVHRWWETCGGGEVAVEAVAAMINLCNIRKHGKSLIASDYI